AYIEAALAGSRPQMLIYEDCYADTAYLLRQKYEFRGVVRIGGNPGGDEVAWTALENTDAAGARFPVLDEETVVYHHYACDATSPRAALADFRALWAGSRAAVRGLKLRSGWRILPLFTGGLLVHEPLMRALRLGGCLVLSRKLHPRDIVPLLVRQKVEVVMAPASYYHLLCDWLEQSGTACPSEVRIFEARGHVPLGLRERAKRLLRNEIIETRAPAEALGPAAGGIPEALGAPAAPVQIYPGFRERIVGLGGQDAAEGTPGEWYLQGEAIASRILVPGEGEHAALDQQGWLPTGMFVSRQTSGELVDLGSRYDVLLRDHRRVFINLVALIAEKLAGVREAAGAVVESEAGGLEFVIAFLAEPSSSLSAELLLEELGRRLPAAEMPDHALRLDYFPRLPDGNIDRERLRAEVRKRLWPERE
ncbi:MAG: hypothetical protein N3A66_00315, partial [Planctomycetota bacterium]|nr:hypothetical protein [Planctomycetota bacterium]